MKSGKLKMPVFAFFAALCMSLDPAFAQTKPTESASKVKKVMLYNKIGGWVHSQGSAEVESAMRGLALAKGFELVVVNEDLGLTPGFLREFQVIVWNNNTDGLRSVPSASAREAVLNYLNLGGGWMLIHGAAYAESWPELRDALGTRFTVHGYSGPAKVVLDSAAAGHRELKWMVEGFPTTIPLRDTWDSYLNTVRPLEGVTVVATAQSYPGSQMKGPSPMGDASGDHTYIWAREIGQGRLIFNAIGHGQNDLMAQQDSIVPRLYWENLRYAAGDYRNGCTDPANPGFDPAARVHIEAMCSGTGLKAAPPRSGLVVSKGALRIRIPSPEGRLQVRLRDLRGTLVRERNLPAGTHDISLDAAIRPGVYHFEIRGEAGALQRRLVLP